MTTDLLGDLGLTDLKVCEADHCLFAVGDTINTASRMESTSFPMAVQLSAAAVADAANADRFSALGERMIKGKGIMSTFLLKVCMLLLKSETMLAQTLSSLSFADHRSASRYLAVH